MVAYNTWMVCLLGWILAMPVNAGWKAGAAKVDITPDYPVRLSGYGNRTTEHEGVVRAIHARALALAWTDEKPAVVITVDNCGVPGSLRSEVVKALSADGVVDERLAICSSHTHCAPMLNGVLSNLFGKDIPADQQARIDRYTRELRDHLISVARKAISSMAPATVDLGHGKVLFASNRRFKTPSGFQNSPNPYGPKDHSLPVLRICSPEGKRIATFTSYACHCTTVDMNKIHGDWAGCASDDVEQRFPGIIALTAIGCGGDQNPYPRKHDEMPILHGITLARELVRVINQPMTPVDGPIHAATKHITLNFAPPPEKEQLQKKAKTAKGAARRHAETLLKEITQKGSISTELPYMVQAWNFTDDLAMVFLPGEIVVDYGLRLKREFGASRLWVNGYSNDVPCYIASERLLGEGGYEVESSMIYYMRPGPLASGTENKIIRAVHAVVDQVFKSTKKSGTPVFASPR